ncbi:MAG: family 10 glycosylhydrolase [Clostridia bacterium]|nr:family 10 glycosylhydrolase [Clostridia bacterium]
MKRKVLKISVVCLILFLIAIIGVCVFAIEGEYTRDVTKMGLTVTANGQTITGVYSDPVDYWEVASGGSLNDYEIRYDTVGDVDSVIYTGYYPDTTTGRVGDNVVEYVCEKQDKTYVVTSINTSGDGTTYIPLNGFVLSVNKTVVSEFAKVGDVVTIGGEIVIPTRAVESSSGKRIVVDATNANRSMPMVVYYDYQFGEKTGTNVFGTEMICKFDFENNTFVVESFRPFLSGDDSGSVIPDNGFVLSAYGEGYRALLAVNELFKVGDEVKMVGFDYVRFGGTVYGTFDHINPTKETNPNAMETATEEFPAFRGTNQTIIYKDGWDYKGAAGTGTNVYGFEAAVDANGIVVELGVNVSKIPEGGYVISGHGVGRDFIRSNVVLGATIVLDEVNKTYSISTTLNSYYENLVTNVQTVIDVAKSRIKQLYDVNVDVINEYITKVETELETLRELKESIEAKLSDPELTEDERLALLMNYNNSQLKIEKLRQQILVSSAESKAVSARAVWHRPIEMTYAEIKTNVEMYKEIGINLVFVETLYNGYSSFRSEVEEFPYHKNLAPTYTDENGNVYNDYLSAFVACCVENGIEVHAWVENFYVGIDPNVQVLKMHPDWVMYNEDGTTVQRNEGGPYYFIDPANKEVQDTLIAYYNDLLAKNPDIAGLNLDYIRYPVSNELEDTGFTMSAMKGFYDLLGKTFTDNQLSDRTKMYNKFKQLFDKDYLLGGQEEADKNYKQWISYRMSVVTEYVRRIKNEVKDTNGVMLSTAVFASLTESTDAKKQDWRTWFLNGWIDLATPMAYYNDATDVNARVKDMILMAGNNCLYYTGIASSYSGLPAWQNKEHIEASYNAGANGYVIFCSTQIIGHEDVQNALKSGVNSKWAVLPHAAIEEVLTAMFESILDKADRLYIPAGGMTEQNKADLEAVFAEIIAMPCDNAEDIYNIVKALQSLSKTDIKNYAKGYSRQRIIEQLNELAEILDARISMQLIEDGEWDPETEPTRPSFEEENNNTNTPVVPNPPVDDNTNDNNNTQEPEELGFFARIIQAIILFFKRLFGLV